MSSVGLWNSLNNEVRSASSVSSYKSTLEHVYFENFEPSLDLLYKLSFTRHTSILPTGLRLGFSGLNSYLFRIKCKLSPGCACGYRVESCAPLFHFMSTISYSKICAI